jgi:hypothetical protein
MTGDAKRAAWKTAGVRLNRMDNGVTELLAEPGVPPEVVVFAGWDLFDRTCRLHVPLAAFIHVFVGPLERRFPNDANVLALKGRAYVDWAWEARGGGWANTVTPQGWKDMAARLDEASAALTRAWQLDPDDADVAVEMINVELGRNGDRDVMEAWFKRAMAADPDCYAACTSKLYFLEPKWHGSAEDMLAFGRECVAGGNWRERLPAVLIDAHVALAAYEADKDAYWLKPGVWDDVVRVYAEHVRLFPDDSDIRGYYAKFAYKCHQWKVLNEQLAKLGKDADPEMFGDGTPAALEAARTTAARLADDPAAQGR